MSSDDTIKIMVKGMLLADVHPDTIENVVHDVLDRQHEERVIEARKASLKIKHKMMTFVSQMIADGLCDQ